MITEDDFYVNSAMRNIYMQVEPEGIHPHEKQIIEKAAEYTYILTYNENILKQCPNAYKYIYGTTTISPDQYNSIDVKNKVFRITSITGNKSGLPGYKFRHDSYSSQNQITSIPTRFFISSRAGHTIIPKKNRNTPHLNKNSKINVFVDSQFSLVIENSKQANYFTEKLCDCLITKTIPVYWGCPNISEYFDTTGWILLEDESVENLAKKLNALTPEYYMKYTDTIEKNFKEVKNYTDIVENINKALRKIPDY